LFGLLLEFFDFLLHRGDGLVLFHDLQLQPFFGFALRLFADIAETFLHALFNGQFQFAFGDLFILLRLAVVRTALLSRLPQSAELPAIRSAGFRSCSFELPDDAGRFGHVVGQIPEFAQLWQQGWNVALDNAPQNIVVDPQVAVDQPVTGGDDEPPR
jgi:hypothetical protein